MDECLEEYLINGEPQAILARDFDGLCTSLVWMGGALPLVEG